jgi:hypothetical protein
VADKILHRIQSELGEGGLASARLLPTAAPDKEAEAPPEEAEAVKEKVAAES